MHAADIREVARKVQHTAICIEDVRSAEKRVEHGAVRTVLKKLQKAAARARKMMDGAVGSGADAVPDLDVALLPVRQLQVISQALKKTAIDGRLEGHPSTLVESGQRGGQCSRSSHHALAITSSEDPNGRR